VPNNLSNINISPGNKGSFGVNGVNEFAFSPCGTFLAVASQDGFLRVFKFLYKSNQQLHIEFNCSMKSYFGGLLCLAWSNDGKYIATGGEDDLITLFSFTEMRVVLRGRGHSSWINCVAFDPWTKLQKFDPEFKIKTDENINKENTEFESKLEYIENLTLGKKEK
jgi:WD40 repeat protein